MALLCLTLQREDIAVFWTIKHPPVLLGLMVRYSEISLFSPKIYIHKVTRIDSEKLFVVYFIIPTVDYLRF